MLFKRIKSWDTIQQYEQAASDRYSTGQGLIEDRASDGIYLLGYVAEMLLKAAYFRFNATRLGITDTSDVDGRKLRDAAAMGVRLGIISAPDDTEGYHSLLFWTLLLIETRKAQSQGLAARLERELEERMQLVHALWTVEMRYQSISFSVTDALFVRGNVTWLRDHYEELWR